LYVGSANYSKELIMSDWNQIHITDKTGAVFFNTTASPMSTMSEIRNLKRHIEHAKQFPQYYNFLDVDTAVVMLNGSVYSTPSDNEIDDLLKELGV
jgi:hypothetical protein